MSEPDAAENSALRTQDSSLREDEEISLLDLLIVLAKQKRLVLGLPLGTAVLAVIVTLLMPNIYTGTAKILPPQQSQSTAAAMLGQILGPAAGLATSVGIKNPSDLYVGMLQSRSVADAMIARFELQKLYDKTTLTDTRKALADVSTFKAGKDGIITIEVDDEDPKRAAEMANAYVEELDRLTQTIAVTEGGQRRLYFEKQLRFAKDSLAEAEVALQKTQEKTGLIRLDEQGKAIIEAIANLRAQIAGKQVQLTTMRSFATERNPDLIRTQQELAGLRAELAKLEKKGGGNDGSIFVPTGQVPELGLEYIRKYRDMKYHETLYEVMAKQYEIARADEAKDSGIIQILDRAVVPDRKSKPRRTVIAIATGFVAGIIAVMLAFLREALGRTRRDPVQAERLHLLRRYLWSKR